MVQTVYVIQEDENSLEELMRTFNKPEFNVLGGTLSGEEGVKQVQKLQPSLVVSGIATRGIDGLEVIERIKNNNSNTKVIIYSSVDSENVLRSATKRGALYYFIKPINEDLFLKRTKELLNDNVANCTIRTSLDEKISKIFITVGIPPHIKGYSYLREGVKMAVSEPSIINSITKQLYPKIGERYSTSPSKVERAIRHAIEVAWNRGRIESINHLFGVRAYVGSEKPTNGEFIALVADRMLLEGA